MKKNHILLLLIVVISACKTSSVKKSSLIEAHPELVKVSFQDRILFYNSDRSVGFTNQFASARMNAIQALNDSTFAITITAENTPVNPSPWFAFKVFSSYSRNVHIQLRYENVRHRYLPKISTDGKNWLSVDTVYTNERKSEASFVLPVSADTMWVAAQELYTSKDNEEWVELQAKKADIRSFRIGESLMGKPLPALRNTNAKSKDVVVIISRQHPPEVTGYLAMRAFVEEVYGDSPLATSFRKQYEMLVVPMMNPDGVDEGHWRHNIGGVDLNRDWTAFVQPETRAVKEYLEKRVAKGARVVFFLDFHSTYYDIFYTNEDSTASYIPGFTNQWLRSMEASREGYKANVSPSGNGGVVSKAWFNRALKAEAITYEVGDLTPRDYLSTIGKLAAENMMKELLQSR